MELYAESNPPKTVAPQAYANLIKSFWILVDIFANHPQRPFLPSRANFEVQFLSAELKGVFKRINALGLAIPDVSTLNEQSLQIWETHSQGPLVQVGRRQGRKHSSPNQAYLWHVDGEQLYFQRFAFYQRHGLQTQPACLLLFLVHEVTKVARVVAQGQNGSTLMEINLLPNMAVHEEDCSITIDTEHVTFPQANDALLFYSTLEAAQIYMFHRNPKDINLSTLKAIILMIAVKNNCASEIKHLWAKNLDSSSIRPVNHGASDLLVVASDLASLVHSFQEEHHARDPLPLTHWAALQGHYEVLIHLLSEGLHYAEKDEQGRLPLHLAAEGGHTSLVQLLLDSGTDVDIRDQREQTPLLVAAKNGSTAVTLLLLESGAEIDAKDANGQTPLSLAAANGWDSVVKLLLDKEADLTEGDKQLHKPLYWAAYYGHEAPVKLLLEKRGPTVNLALPIAAGRGHKGVVRLLLSRYARPLKVNHWQQEALAEAAGAGHLEIVGRLLLEGVGPNYLSQNYRSKPLGMAAENGHSAVVKLLLEHGAFRGKTHVGGVWSFGDDRQSPLSRAAMNGHAEVVKLLLETGVPADCKNYGGRTPLGRAAANGHVQVIKLLVANGADLHGYDDGYMPLHRAAYSGQRESMKALLEVGADLKRRAGYHSETPLIAVASNRNCPLIDFCLEHGANLEVKDDLGRTPLIWAAWQGHESALKLLLRRGADIEAKARYGETAIGYAAENRGP